MSLRASGKVQAYKMLQKITVSSAERLVKHREDYKNSFTSQQMSGEDSIAAPWVSSYFGISTI